MKLIDNHDIDSWASSHAAKSKFPYWVRELIQASVSPQELRLPHGDAVWMPGLDGVVFCKSTHPYVPDGGSVWEIGTNNNFRTKAERDYYKRLEDKLDDDGNPIRKMDRSNTVFVFVTPRPWSDKSTWEQERKKDGLWKDVRVIDGEEIKNWLESAPAVALRFASEIKRVPETGLWTIEQAWDDWSQLSEPATSEELVIAGREEQEKELLQKLAGPPETYTIRADSPREAWGFALAAIRRIDKELERENFLSRTIIAQDEATANGLRHRLNLIVVLKQASEGVSGTLAKSGCHVIVPEGNNFFGETRNAIVLSRPTLRKFTESLQNMPPLTKSGTSDSAAWAEREARACGLSVTIFQRLNPHANATPPAWAKRDDVGKLIPALLAGRWDSDNKNDQTILCQLAGLSEYGDVVDQLKTFLHVNEPPLRKLQEKWTLSAPVDAFQLIASHLGHSDLTRFKAAFIEVFGRIDGKVELPPDEWFFHSDGEAVHSTWLRTGLAETLLLIRERGERARIDSVTPRAYAEEVIRSIPGLRCDWRVLASIRDQYPMLMEAAPDPLLESLELLLEAASADMQRLFEEGEGIFGGGSMHTGMLWGLETLAWNPKYLARAALLLAHLAKIDPGGRLVNRPINSLREIFLWWHPGTNAGLESRLSTIDQILKHYPEVGWELLEKMLPNSGSRVSHGTRKPRWNTSGQVADDLRTPRGQMEYLGAIIDRAIERLGSDAERWRVALESLDAFSMSQRESVIQKLEDLSQSTLSIESRNSIWEMLRELTTNHKAFQDTDWALPKDVLTRLETTLSRFSPTDPVERHRWLFESWFPERPNSSEKFDEAKQQIRKNRYDAVGEIFDVQGLKGLLDLGQSCRFPGLVAEAAVSKLPNIKAVRSLLDFSIQAGGDGVSFASQISGAANRHYGTAWQNNIVQGIKSGAWTPNISAQLLSLWADTKDTWNLIAELGSEISNEYWRLKIFSLSTTEKEDQIYQIKQLLSAGRAIEVLHDLAYHGTITPSDILVQVLDSAVEHLASLATKDEIQKLAISSYDLAKYLDLLRSRNDLPDQEIARREYQILPLLGHRESSGLSIHRIMAQDPKFFVDVVCDVFLPKNSERTQNMGPNDEAKSRAQSGYRLLDGMSTIPGDSGDGDIDEIQLGQWINGVRKHAEEHDRLEVSEIYIGHILAHAPQDPNDGGWPHRTIRNVFEEISNKSKITQGLIVERHNMRGVYTKSLYEGGAQERQLADQYLSWAKLCQLKWPSMAHILNKIADSWTKEAERADQEAEQDKLNLN